MFQWREGEEVIKNLKATRTSFQELAPSVMIAAIAESFGPAAIGAAVSYSMDNIHFLKVLCYYGIIVSIQISIKFGGVISRSVGSGFNQIDGDPIVSSMVKSVMLISSALAILLSACLVVFLGGFLGVGIAIAVSIFAILVSKRSTLLHTSHGLRRLILAVSWILVSVVGTFYISSESLSIVIFLAAIPPVLIVVAIRLLSCLYDFDIDRRMRQRNVAVMMGRYNALTGYKFLVFGSYLVPIALAASKQAGAFILLPLCTLPLARVLSQKVECDLDVNISALKQSTVRLFVVFSLLFSLGFVVQF